MMRIYLTGFMGAGKSSVGEHLSRLLGYPMLDLDREVEVRSGLGVREIFTDHGEATFREWEHACLKETARLEDAVVATGGGTMTFPRNVAVMRQLGRSVWLHPSFATIAGRLDADGRAERPLFEDVGWNTVVDQNRDASIGDWVRLLHAVLRRKARCEAAGEEVTTITTRDLTEETARFKQAQKRIRPAKGGNYV